MDEVGAWTAVLATPIKSILRVRFDVVPQTSKRRTATLTGSRVGDLQPQLFTGCVHRAPQNAPQIASRAVFSRRIAVPLSLVKWYGVVSNRLVKNVLTLSHG